MLGFSWCDFVCRCFFPTKKNEVSTSGDYLLPFVCLGCSRDSLDERFLTPKKNEAAGTIWQMLNMLEVLMCFFHVGNDVQASYELLYYFFFQGSNI